MFHLSNDIIQKLSVRKRFIKDFDGVFYKEPGDIYDFCDEICAQAAMGVIKGLEYAMAYSLAQASYETYRNTTGAYVEYVKQNHPNMDLKKVELKIFQAYHTKKWEGFQTTYPELLNKHGKENTAGDLLAIKQAGVDFSVLSHACSENFLIPFLRHIGVGDDTIPAEKIWGGKESKFKNKQDSADAITAMMETSGHSPDETAFIEDSLANLQMAKSVHPDLLTILISDKPEYLANAPQGVDIVVPDYFLLVKAMHYAHVIAPSWRPAAVTQANSAVFSMPSP